MGNGKSVEELVEGLGVIISSCLRHSTSSLASYTATYCGLLALEDGIRALSDLRGHLEMLVEGRFNITSRGNGNLVLEDSLLTLSGLRGHLYALDGVGLRAMDLLVTSRLLFTEALWVCG